jgi:pSer/pThr/pTyr-binding forkhead associated (FHA) protein
MQTLTAPPHIARPRTQTYAVGRRAESDFVIDDRTVSRHHATIRNEGTFWVLVDIGSTNGTRVNGVRIDGRAVIAPGDEIGFGAAVARFDPDERRLFSSLRVEEPTGEAA